MLRIGIIGLGLIGGSIFKKLKQLSQYEILGISRSVKEDNVTTDYNSLKECDLVFVCTPMNITPEILDKLEQILPSKTVVTDVCSLKTFVSKKKYSYNFIPSHPMAGTEFSGWDNSFPELFNKAKWVITPLDGIENSGQTLLENVINDLGAEIIITTPEEHDKAVALISHMPLLVAQALCQNIKDNKLAQTLASSGFRDTTRLALSNTEMANDMVELNSENIKTAFLGVENAFKTIIEKNYKQHAENIKAFRKNLYS